MRITIFSFLFCWVLCADAQVTLAHRLVAETPLTDHQQTFFKPISNHGPILKKGTSIMLRQDPDLTNILPATAFFCRIEDAIARTSKINMKFRLGSVQYVDALEGKGYFEALSYSKATNFYLSRKN